MPTCDSNQISSLATNVDSKGLVKHACPQVDEKPGFAVNHKVTKREDSLGQTESAKLEAVENRFEVFSNGFADQKPSQQRTIPSKCKAKAETSTPVRNLCSSSFSQQNDKINMDQKPAKEPINNYNTAEVASDCDSLSPQKQETHGAENIAKSAPSNGDKPHNVLTHDNRKKGETECTALSESRGASELRGDKQPRFSTLSPVSDRELPNECSSGDELPSPPSPSSSESASRVPAPVTLLPSAAATVPTKTRNDNLNSASMSSRCAAREMDVPPAPSESASRDRAPATLTTPSSAAANVPTKTRDDNVGLSSSSSRVVALESDNPSVPSKCTPRGHSLATSSPSAATSVPLDIPPARAESTLRSHATAASLPALGDVGVCAKPPTDGIAKGGPPSAASPTSNVVALESVPETTLGSSSKLSSTSFPHAETSCAPHAETLSAQPDRHEIPKNWRDSDADTSVDAETCSASVSGSLPPKPSLSHATNRSTSNDKNHGSTPASASHAAVLETDRDQRSETSCSHERQKPMHSTRGPKISISIPKSAARTETAASVSSPRSRPSALAIAEQPCLSTQKRRKQRGDDSPTSSPPPGIVIDMKKRHNRSPTESQSTKPERVTIDLSLDEDDVSGNVSVSKKRNRGAMLWCDVSAGCKSFSRPGFVMDVKERHSRELKQYSNQRNLSVWLLICCLMRMKQCANGTASVLRKDNQGEVSFVSFNY